MSTVVKAAALGGVTGAMLAVPVEVLLLALQAPAVPGGLFGAVGAGAVVGTLVTVGIYKGKVDRLERDVATKADKEHVESLHEDVQHIRDAVDRITDHLLRN